MQKRPSKLVAQLRESPLANSETLRLDSFLILSSLGFLQLICFQIDWGVRFSIEFACNQKTLVTPF